MLKSRDGWKTGMFFLNGDVKNCDVGKLGMLQNWGLKKSGC